MAENTNADVKRLTFERAIEELVLGIIRERRMNAGQIWIGHS